MPFLGIPRHQKPWQDANANALNPVCMVGKHWALGPAPQRPLRLGSVTLVDVILSQKIAIFPGVPCVRVFGLVG